MNNNENNIPAIPVEVTKRIRKSSNEVKVELERRLIKIDLRQAFKAFIAEPDEINTTTLKLFLDKYSDVAS
jgi:hypothetical protein